jgi:hypothetical protein
MTFLDAAYEVLQAPRRRAPPQSQAPRLPLSPGPRQGVQRRLVSIAVPVRGSVRRR